MSDQNTKGRLSIKENGDANSYALLDESGKWLLSVLHNGEKLTSVQRETMRRVAACWNACEGISTDNLEDNRAVAWLAQRYNEAVKQRDELLKAILELREANSQYNKERGGPWVFHRVSPDTQRRVYAAHQALNAAILKATGEQA